MSQYALLCNPGHNRVYFQGAEHLSLGELNLTLSRFSIPCEKGEIQEFGKVRYLTFTSAAPLEEREISAAVTAFFCVCRLSVGGRASSSTCGTISRAIPRRSVGPFKIHRQDRGTVHPFFAEHGGFVL